MTLTKALFPTQSLVTKGLMVLAGSVLIALAAQVQVPMYPVPMTLQTFAILVVGFGLGARLGAAAVVAYLVEGAMGLPVFAGGASTAALIGPTAGFLFGFVPMAFLAGLAADRGVGTLIPTALVAILVSALLYVPGLLWPAMTMGIPANDLLAGWMSPFLVGDAVKAILAAFVVSGGWSVLGKRSV